MNTHFSNKQKTTIWIFLWEILKPYKGWCVLMVQAPIFSTYYLFANSYSLKLLIDAFSRESTIGYSHFFVDLARTPFPPDEICIKMC